MSSHWACGKISCCFQFARNYLVREGVLTVLGDLSPLIALYARNQFVLLVRLKRRLGVEAWRADSGQYFEDK